MARSKLTFYFVAFDTTLPQHFAKLFTLNCVSGDYSIQPIHEYEEKIQYSPAVEKVTQKYIHLADWQNISGKSYPVSVIIDKYTWKTYYIRSESLT
ncbi:MAG TPA: hypothetical protein PLW93_06120, partial [Candidatus Absconditabacterales bacterium]|nr:hypothetical protein [Candidatus Absconditabacterales bacterium]